MAPANERRGTLTRKRFVFWHGPYPLPGDGVRFDGSQRRYVIRDRVPASTRMTRTVFVLWLVELGPEDPEPDHVHRCVRNVRNGFPFPRPIDPSNPNPR